MANTYGRKSGGGINWLLVVLGAVGVTVLLFVMDLSRVESPEDKRAHLAEKFDAEVGSDQRFGGLMPKFKAGFPAEYEKLKAQEITAIEANASEDQRGTLAYNFMTDFLHSHISDATVAPSANLKEFRTKQLVLTAALQRSSEQQCADYFIRGIGPGAQLDAASQDAMGRLTTTILDAIVAGQQDTTIRPDMTNGDRLAMVQGLERNGFSRNELSTLGNEKKMAALPVHDQCVLGIAFERGINSLPEALADKITVAIIKDSEKRAQHKT